MPEQAPDIDVKSGQRGRLVYDKAKRTIVAKRTLRQEVDRIFWVRLVRVLTVTCFLLTVFCVLLWVIGAMFRSALGGAMRAVLG
jgi:hypothetical protein